MRENEFSIVGKVAVAIGLLMLAAAASRNLVSGDVTNPGAFGITLVGFALFLMAKLSVVREGHLVSFGVGRMSPEMKNAYRAGYWLMAVGVLAMFGP